jgi:hypothetical protein
VSLNLFAGRQALAKSGALLCSMLVLSACGVSAYAQNADASLRPPAVPLVTHDPYFSIWSMADKLTDQNTKHWTGSEQPLTGLVRIDGVTYRYMGARPRLSVPPMLQVLLSVTPTHTIYTFEQAGIRLGFTFFTPAFPEDLDVLSRPVTYLAWDVTASDEKNTKSPFIWMPILFSPLILSTSRSSGDVRAPARSRCSL